MADASQARNSKRTDPIPFTNHHHQPTDHGSFPSLDATPRRFSTGASGLPMPGSRDFAAASLTAAQTEEEKGSGSGSRTPKDKEELNAAISRLSLYSSKPSIARLAALASPCYFHKRFGDAVDIATILEEIKSDVQLSHSRLMQTAASVREVSRQLQRRPLKRAAKNVMIVTKARDNELVALTRELALWLLATPRYGKDVGVNVWVDSKLQKSKRFDTESLLAQDERFESMLRFWTPALCLEKPDMFDLVITLGGDGTVLYTSWLFQRIVPPVLAFSLGSLGFLTNFDFTKYKEQLTHIMGDTGMRVNMRMRFTCTIYRAAAGSHNISSIASSVSLNTTSATTTPFSSSGNPDRSAAKIEGETHEVLNELVIDRGPSSYVSSLDLYANDSLLTRISADGIILSTPTGSTAYSLSAGGSLVHPDIPAILLTPICPHTLSFRPMLLNDDVALKVAIPSSGRGGAFVSFDGKGRVELGRGDEVVVRASQYPFPTVTAHGLEWFDSISRTLRWNTRAAEQKGWAGSGSGSGTAGSRGAGPRTTSDVGEFGDEGDEELAVEDDEDEFDIDFDPGDGSAGSSRAGDSGYEGTNTSSETGGSAATGERWRGS